jgi:hypothetical protein
MELFILPAGAADAEEIAAVQRMSWQATYAKQLSPISLARAEAAWDVHHWRDSLERGDARSFTLALTGPAGIVGFGTAGRARPDASPAGRL